MDGPPAPLALPAPPGHEGDAAGNPSSRRTAGRPRDLDQVSPEDIAQICTILGNGNSFRDVADYLGIRRESLSLWVKRGRREKRGPYREFYHKIKHAIAAGSIDRIARIRLAGNGGNWPALAWIQERRHPARWGRRRLEITAGPRRLSVDAFGLGAPAPELDERELMRRDEAARERVYQATRRILQGRFDPESPSPGNGSRGGGE